MQLLYSVRATYDYGGSQTRADMVRLVAGTLLLPPLRSFVGPAAMPCHGMQRLATPQWTRWSWVVAMAADAACARRAVRCSVATLGIVIERRPRCVPPTMRTGAPKMPEAAHVAHMLVVGHGATDPCSLFGRSSPCYSSTCRTAARVIVSATHRDRAGHAVQAISSMCTMIRTSTIYLAGSAWLQRRADTRHAAMLSASLLPPRRRRPAYAQYWSVRWSVPRPLRAARAPDRHRRRRRRPL